MNWNFYASLRGNINDRNDFRSLSLRIHAQTKNVRTSIKNGPPPRNMRTGRRTKICCFQNCIRTIRPILNQSGSVSTKEPVLYLTLLRERTSRPRIQIFVKVWKITEPLRITVLVNNTRLDVFKLAVHPLRSRMWRILGLDFSVLI